MRNNKDISISQLSNECLENSVITLQKQLVKLEQENDVLKEELQISRDIKNKFEDLYNDSPNGYFTFDHNGYIIDVNQSGGIMLSYNKESLINKLFHVYIVREYWGIFNTFFYNAFEKSNKQACEIQLINKDGHIFWVQLESIVVTNTEQGIKQCRTAIIDISERKESERLIAIKQLQLRTAQKTANLGNWQWDFKTGKIICSDQLYRILGIEPQTVEITPRIFLSKVSPFYRDILIQGMQKVITNRNTFKIDIDVFTREKTIKRVNFIAKLEINKKNDIVQLFGTAQDISERKKVEDKLLKKTKELNRHKELLEKKAIEMKELNHQLSLSEKELKELNENKDKFLAIISHNLKNPFTVLLGLSDLLANDIKELDTNQIIKIASKINQNSNRIFNLLNQLLNWSKLQLDRTELQLKPVEVCAAINNAINLFSENASKKEIIIQNKTKEGITIIADTDMFGSVLQNFISNAIKFSHPGQEVIITSAMNNKNAEISIIDFGVGMNKKTASNLFKLEKSQSTLGTTQEQGTGLGLIICKELIERQNGQIHVESEEGKGCRFTFTLPLYFHSETIAN